MIPATPDEIESDVATCIDPKSRAIVTVVGPAFYRGLSRSDNAAEVTLAQSFVKQAVALCGLTDQCVEALMAQIARSTDARHMHAFAPQDFRDNVLDAIGRHTSTDKPA